jgi:DNA polymerase-3 subunit delta'
MRDLAEGIEERLEKTGVWEAPAPTDSIYVATIRAVVQRAALTPAMANRKVIVVGDAHRMISQEGSDQAANAFLKLLEEPLPNTTIILTSSSPSSLLPTIRSRVIAVRVPALTPDARRQLEALGVHPKGASDAAAAAAQLYDAAKGDDAARFRVAFRQGGAGARGGFTASLDALTALLHDKARAATENDHDVSAAGHSRAIAVVEEAKRLARQNGNPQLITATLLMDLAPLVS